MQKKTVFILSTSSDIGLELAKRYLKDGYTVIGTYRTWGRLDEIASFSNCQLLRLDITKKTDVLKFISAVKHKKTRWDIFISCVGEPRPLISFFASDFDDWERSVRVNSLDQLRVLHSLYPFRNTAGTPTVIFFAGGGIHRAVINFSAYTISKIMLTKMCELINVEEKDMNIFIVGPGWTKTKIHRRILNDPHVSEEKRQETVRFLKTGEGTSMQDIYECIRWLSEAGKLVASGRNFSVVYDPWKGKKKQEQLVKNLKKNRHIYTLRRFGDTYTL